VVILEFSYWREMQMTFKAAHFRLSIQHHLHRPDSSSIFWPLFIYMLFIL
jgi:hypothetical protein